MAFVTCTQFSKSQAEQDKAIAALQTSDTTQDSRLDALEESQIAQDTAIAALQDSAASALNAVAVESGGGITGNGTAANPLALDAAVIGQLAGSAKGGAALLQALKDNGLLGDGLDVVDGKLIVKTESVKDASDTVHQFYAVDLT